VHTSSPLLRNVILAGTVAMLGLGACTETQQLVIGPDPLGADSAVLLEDFSGRQLLPPDHWWNTDIADAPVDPSSDSIIAFISGRTAQTPFSVRPLVADFGPAPHGIPYVGVSAREPLSPLIFTQFALQSDTGIAGGSAGYPIPRAARDRSGIIEGAIAGGGTSGNRRLILVDRDRNLLFETRATRWNALSGRWEAGVGAIFPLLSNERRPDGWPSADLSGLAVFPGLVRHDEATRNAPITHAFRVTVRASNGFVYPAGRAAGFVYGAAPLGARLRLRQTVDLSGHPVEVRRILEAMKTYGLIVSDEGTDMAVTGTMDPRWDRSAITAAFSAIDADDFEVIDLGWRGGPPQLRQGLHGAAQAGANGPSR